MKIIGRKGFAILSIFVSLLGLSLFVKLNEEGQDIKTVSKIYSSIIKREPHLTDPQKLEAMGSRNASELVAPQEFTAYINPPRIAFKKDGKDEVSILILVTSMAGGKLRRELIRNTWSKWITQDLDIKIFFYIGLPKSSPLKIIRELQIENAIHKDLIVDDFSEGYFRLTLKTLRMLKWFLQMYKGSSSKPDFLIKTDHDVFINIPNLVTHLNSILILNKLKKPQDQSHYYIGGDRYLNPKLDPNTQSKFYISSDFWFGKKISQYPTYVGGPCYILSGDLVERMYEASFSIPLFPFEDIYLTGLIPDYLNLTISHALGIETKIYSTHKIIKSKKELGKAISLHPMEPAELMETVYKKTLKLNEFSEYDENFIAGRLMDFSE